MEAPGSDLVMPEEKIRRSANALLEDGATLATATDRALYAAWGEAMDRMIDSDIAGNTEMADHWKRVADMLEASGRRLSEAADRRVGVRHESD